MTASLFDHHRKLLEDRAIAPAVIQARGYSSTTVPGWLREEGFSHAVSERVPGLVIPVRDVHGDLRFSQYRPDKPRMRDGKPAKYELPHRARLVLDVPPPVLTRLGSPARPLWITEGPLKADAAVSAGLDCIATFGVWGWRGRNGRGGKTALACWEDIALAGRTVYLVPDSDAATNPKVADAIGRLGAMLASRDANVRYVYLPTAADGGKTGLDDWLAVHGPDVDGLLALAADEPPAPLRTHGVQGTPGISGTPPPRAVPVPADPAALLDELRGWLESYVAFPSAHAAVAVTLWAVHTHLVSRFDSTGRLVLLSPEPECGKTRVLELAELTCAGAEMLNDASAAYLFRRIGSPDAGPVTVLLDECDAIWKRKGDENAEALRSIVNAGHRKGATVGRVEMNSHDAKLQRFPVYAPAALAAKGDPLPDTIMSRAVVVRMRRRAPGQEVRRYRQRITRPEGQELRGKLAAWAESVAARVGDRWPDLPDGVDDRPADVWEPLVMVADLAGGDWPRLARDACTALVKGAREDDQGITTRLLADLQAVFGDAEALWTETILDRLHKLEEAPWGDWYGHPLNPRDLAKLLKPYGIKPGQVRKGEANRQGYPRPPLADAWTRYLPAQSPTTPTTPTPLASHVGDVGDVGDTPGGDGTTPLWKDEDPGQAAHHAEPEDPPAEDPEPPWPEGTLGAEASAPDDDDASDDEYPF